MVSIVCAFIKGRAGIKLLRRRRLEFDVQMDDYTAKHMAKAEDAATSIKLTYTNLASGVLEDLPLGILGVHSSSHPNGWASGVGIQA